MANVTSWQAILEPLSEPASISAHDVHLPQPASDPQAEREEAEAMLASARADAAELIEDARIQAESLREAAWQEGFHQGQVEARVTVETEAHAVRQTRDSAMRDELECLITGIVTAREALWQRQEPEMVGLVLDIARQVVKAEIQQNPEVVRQVMTNAIRRITDKDNVRVRVSLADAPHVKEMRQDILEMVDGLRHLEIIDDRRIGEGGCVIETNAGTIDAKIETQLAEVARALEAAENG